MAQIKMVALKRHPYGVGTREKGEEYDANPQEAKTLKAIGWAREVEPAKTVAKPEPEKVETRDLKPEKKPAKKAAKQTYRTRDMKAKD